MRSYKYFPNVSKMPILIYNRENSVIIENPLILKMLISKNIVLVNNITEIGIVIVRCKTYTGSDYPFDIFKLF